MLNEIKEKYEYTLEILEKISNNVSSAILHSNSYKNYDGRMTMKTLYDILHNDRIDVLHLIEDRKKEKSKPVLDNGKIACEICYSNNGFDENNKPTGCFDPKSNCKLL